MGKKRKKYFSPAERPGKENKDLLLQLHKAEKSVNAIKTGNIDALVISGKKDIKVYTDKTADITYRNLVEKMNEGAVTMNKDGTILYCNYCFAGMVNLPLQKIIGTKFRNFIDNTSNVLYDSLIKQGWKKAVSEEIYIHANDGKVIPVRMSVNAFSLDADLILCMILTDLTSQNKNREELNRWTKQLEKKNVELERTNNELAWQIGEKEKKTAELVVANTDIKELDALNMHKENILALLSHDLRSPLTHIIGIADYLKSNFQKIDQDEIKQMLDILYSSSTDELIMLDYLVQWARIKYAAEVFSPVKIDLSEKVKKVLDLFNEYAFIHKINLYNKIEKGTVVFADEKMLFSVLQNIISNAIKFTPEGEKITVSAKTKDDKIIVKITDTGSGMSKEMQEKLFTPQMKVLLKEKKENKGAGIGLLLVKGFLEKNGDKIWVESKESEGSSFYFTLPAYKPIAITSAVRKNGMLKAVL